MFALIICYYNESIFTENFLFTTRRGEEFNYTFDLENHIILFIIPPGPYSIVFEPLERNTRTKLRITYQVDKTTHRYSSP